MEQKERKGPSPISEIAFKAEFAYFLGLMIAMVLTYLYPQYRFQPINSTGLILLVLSPLLIFWAQKTSRRFRHINVNEVKAEDFIKGPYKFTRNPTYLGVTLLIFGFGLLLGSIFIVAFAFLSWLVAYFFYRKKEEKKLEQVFGAAYIEYKNKIRSWL